MFEATELENGQKVLKEHFNSPMVYLDHWALNDLSLNKQYKDRFIKAINKRGGMVRLSVYNIKELINQTDKKQINSILKMVDHIDCGFINTNFVDVIKKENYLIENPSITYNPSEELGLIRAYLMSKNWPSKWCISDIIRTVIKEASVQKNSDRTTSFTNKINSLIDTRRNDPESLKKAANQFRKIKAKGQEYQTATRELLIMANDFIIRNKNMKMSNSEWDDFSHVIVPVAYCDIVLIDKRWKSFVSQTGLKPPGIAMVFDSRSIGDFFNQLEEGKRITS